MLQRFTVTDAFQLALGENVIMLPIARVAYCIIARLQVRIPKIILVNLNRIFLVSDRIRNKKIQVF